MTYILTLALTIVISLTIVITLVRALNWWHLSAPAFLVLYAGTTFIISVSLTIASCFIGTPLLADLTFSVGLFMLGGTLLFSLVMLIGREGLRDTLPDATVSRDPHSAAGPNARFDRPPVCSTILDVKWWRNILSGRRQGDECRESVYRTYNRRLRILKADLPPAAAHALALRKSLIRRYRRWHQARELTISPASEAEIEWVEITPFGVMSDADAVKTLAEYAVYQENPKAANGKWLTKAITAALFRLPSEGWEADSLSRLVQAARANRVAWWDLLGPEARKRLDALATQ